MEDGGESGGRPEDQGEAVVSMLRAAVDGVLAQNERAREAHAALRRRGLTEEEAREEVARVLLAVMMHVGEQTERLRSAGGGAGLRREAFRRLAGGESVEEIFGEDET